MVRQSTFRWLARAMPCLCLLLGQISGGRASTIAEVSGLSPPAYKTAIQLGLQTEILRLSTEGRASLGSCLHDYTASIVVEFQKKMTAAAEPNSEKKSVEGLLAEAILGTCEGKESGPTEFLMKQSELLTAKRLFQNFRATETTQILRISAGLQGAIDILKGDEGRGECIVDKFLGGPSAPGFIDLLEALKRNLAGEERTLEKDINEIAAERCGPDAYEKFRKSYTTGKKVERYAFLAPDGRAIFQVEGTHSWFYGDGADVPSRIVDKRIQAPPGGWSSSRPFGNNARDLRTIESAFQKNPFLERDDAEKERKVEIDIGPTRFAAARIDDYERDGVRISACFVTEVQLDGHKAKTATEVTYLDLYCDGTLDKLRKSDRSIPRAPLHDFRVVARNAGI
jgi:hypothetical protein